MAVAHPVVKVVDVYRVAPPPGSVAEASVPLAFFDIFMLLEPSVHQLFFYELPAKSGGAVSQFRDLVLPRLKLSLSLALRPFHILAGKLQWSPKKGELEICYRYGDSVQLTVAESDSDINPSDCVLKEMDMLQRLAPDVPNPGHGLLAVQITVFPTSGICIGVSVHHAAADGSSTMEFVNHWASISRLGVDAAPSISRPIFSRTAVPDPRGFKRLMVQQLGKGAGIRQVPAEKTAVVATFLLGGDRIERLKGMVPTARQPAYSDFTLACSHVWSCLARTWGDISPTAGFAHFKFDSGCRGRLRPPVPAAYFGNCIRPCFVRVAMHELACEDGIRAACEAIWGTILAVRDTSDCEAADDAAGWIPRLGSITEAGEHLLRLSWSPKIGVYGTDFGMGRPRKVEVISSGGGEGAAVTLTEGRGSGGGFEVGVALPRPEMETFSALFEGAFQHLT